MIELRRPENASRPQQVAARDDEEDPLLQEEPLRLSALRLEPSIRLFALVVGIALALPASADSPDTDPSATKLPHGDWDLPPDVPRPDFIRNRPFIPDFLLKDKREGRYWTGIPALGIDVEEGVNVGAFVEIYDNGRRDDPFFRTAPYREKIFFGGVVTSQEVWRLIGRYDRPYVADTPYRIRVDALYEDTQIANYFGVGGSSLDLVSPATGKTSDRYDNYQDSLDRFVQPGDQGCTGPGPCTWSRFNKYESRQVVTVLSLERDLMGGLLRPLLGFQLNWIDVDDLTGQRVDRIASGGSAIQLPTRLAMDCGQNLIRGCNGGWDNGVRLGLTYDSRDFEPNPGSGVLAQSVLYLSAQGLGSSEDYQRLTFSGAYFHDFLAERSTLQQLIFAGRATYNMFFGDPPFYALSGIGSTEFDVRGLGGFRTLRGLKSQRHIGKSAVLLNGELRWFFTEGELFGQHLRPGLALFADTGRSYSDVSLDFARWRYGVGVGFRLAWNLATLISLDLGFSSEDQLFYLELGTSF
jgi:outer membrane protein assembly factor BamA